MVLKRNYRIKHINQKPKSDYSSPIEGNVKDMLSNNTFDRKIKKFCDYTGKSYLIATGILLALGSGCKKGYGVTRISQKRVAEKTRIHKDTVNDYMKCMESHGLIDLWGNKKKSTGWRSTNTTVLVCLYEYAERCAYMYREMMNQKNIAIEKAKVLAKSLIGLKPMHSLSFNTVDFETGEILPEKRKKKAFSEVVLAAESSNLRFKQTKHGI